MPDSVSKLVVGSANFGMNYGLTNRFGKITQLELKSILFEAKVGGVKFIDTAQAYGNSEARIGALCNDGHFEVITKIDVDLENACPTNSVYSLVKQSCQKLNQSRLYAVLLHRPEVLLGCHGKMIIKELQTLKEQNIISKVGVSIYSPEILGEILKLMQLDIVQAPFNIFDQQILSSGWANKLRDSGTEIHTRSVFLQGLLLMQQPVLPAYFYNRWPYLFNTWFDFLNRSGNHALTAALTFALKQQWVDKVVVGVDSALQLKSLIKVERSSVSIDFPQLACDDPELINPSRWRLN